MNARKLYKVSAITLGMKRINLIRHIQEHGCKLLREGNKHSVYVNQAAQKKATVPRHRETKNPTAIKICRQLNVPAPSK